MCEWYDRVCMYMCVTWLVLDIRLVDRYICV